MATGRTVQKWSKVYVDGYDLTGYSRTFGPLKWSFGEADATTLGDAVKNCLPNQTMITPTVINAVLDNTASASHDRLNSQGTRVIMLPIGIRAAPAQGDPVFVGQFLQNNFDTQPTDNSAVMITASFPNWAVEGATLLYANPWGWLLHAKGAETAVNTAVGIDDNNATASTKGGYMAYQLFSSNGTINLKVQDAGTNSDGSFSDLVATGLITAAVTPAAGLVALSNTATVNKYLRWQLTLGTATTATFAIGFVRAFI